MPGTLQVKDLDELLRKKNKHDTGNALDVLPFLTKRTRAIRDQFHKVMGEYIRNVSGVIFNEKGIKKKDFYVSDNENDLSEYIAENVEFKNDEEAVADFVRFLDQYLFNQEDLKPIHPFLFNYMKLDKKLKNEFGKYAQFMSETLVRDHEEIKQVFKDKKTDDILTELILEKLSDFEKAGEPNVNQLYQPLIDPLSKLYQEDLMYISKYKDYFLTAFPLLTHYYVFMYSIQLLFQLERFTEAELEEVKPFYFALEWESLTKRRMAADSIEGYKFVKEHAPNLFPHIHTISQLSHNSLNNRVGENSESISFIPYSTLLQLIQNKGPDYEKEFLIDLKHWIEKYQLWAFKEKIKYEDHTSDLPSAFKMLFECVKEGTSSDVAKKFGSNIDDLGANQFIKNRGSLGPVLNVKHDFLLLMTAVSVKDNRIPLNELFKKFEKRGLKFDRYSRKEIITLLDNLNILDKKSDSGDSQYVKPVL